MPSRTLPTLSRTLVALACAVTLATPTAARARVQDPEPDAASAPTDELNARAQEHVAKAYDNYRQQYYAGAESELRRAAFFAPRWRPLHFNLAVLAEAQGKLNAAVSEYTAFKPFAIGDEQLITEQRILELDQRRREIASGYRRKIVGGGVAVSLGIAGIAGGITLVAIGSSMAKDREVDSGMPDDPTSPDIDESRTTTSNATKRATLVTAGLLTGLVSVLVLLLATPRLRKALKARRQLDGLALGPTRLRLASTGVALRF